MKSVRLSEAVFYLRELLYMTKPQLLAEVPHVPELRRDRTTRTEILVYAFEHKFDATVRPPATMTDKPKLRCSR